MEAGILSSAFQDIIDSGGGTGGGGGGGGTGGTGGGGGHNWKDIWKRIRRRVGGGSSVLVGRGSAESRIEDRLGRIADILENLTINLTLNNNIDGHAISSAVSKQQIRRLQTFI